MSFADDIPVEYLWCKDMRFHVWDPASLVSREVFNRRTEVWEIHRTVRCFNCSTHRTQKLTKAWQPIGSFTYDYPPGYKVDGYKGYVVTPADRAAIRALSTAYRGGTSKPSAKDRKVARETSTTVTPIRQQKKRA